MSTKPKTSLATLAHTATLLERRAAKYLAEAEDDEFHGYDDEAKKARAAGNHLDLRARKIRSEIAGIEELM